MSYNEKQESVCVFSDTVLLDVSEGIATLTLNRPAKLNALDYRTLDALSQAFDHICDNPSASAVILTGAGTAFSAGADIEEFSATVEKSAQDAVQSFVRRGQQLTTKIENFPKPVVVAVNGIAYGGGCEITEAAHLAIASDRALFAKPEVRLGMAPTFGGTQRFPRIAGRKCAFEWLLTGERFSPFLAAEIGLVNRVVPHESLIREARGLAHRIIRHSASGIAAINRAVTLGMNGPIEKGLDIEAVEFGRLAGAPELQSRLREWRMRKAHPTREAV